MAAPMAPEKRRILTVRTASIPAAKPLTAEEIRSIRQNENITLRTLARHLNVSEKLLADWEEGVRQPRRSAIRLLNIVLNKGLQAIA